MPQVSVSVGGRDYLIACDEGQEERLGSLAAYMDDKVKILERATKQAADQRLLVMAALLIADEFFDERDRGGFAAATVDSESGAEDRSRMLEDHAAAALEACAKRIEDLADRVQEA